MNLLLIGCGNLGKCFIKTWLENDTFKNITIVDKDSAVSKKFKNKKINFFNNIDNVDTNKKYDIIMLAIKPQNVDEIIAQVKKYINTKSIILSVIAGKKTNYFYKHLGRKNTIVRIMPNLAASVKESANLCFVKSSAITKEKNIVEKIIKQTGKTFWLKKEEFIDNLTAVSGSGPAYYFVLTQALVASAMAQGIDEKTATVLAKQTLLGSAMFVEDNKNINLKDLTKSVVSKGGVTASALNVIEPIIYKLIHKAIGQGSKRAKELSK